MKRYMCNVYTEIFLYSISISLKKKDFYVPKWDSFSYIIHKIEEEEDEEKEENKKNYHQWKKNEKHLFLVGFYTVYVCNRVYIPDYNNSDGYGAILYINGGGGSVYGWIDTVMCIYYILYV